MRVALLTREYPPEVYGGAGVHVANLSRALADRIEVEVHCFGEPRDDPLVAAAHRPWEALSGRAPELGALRALSVDLLLAAGTGGADLVHSHTWYANLGGHLAGLVHGVPHVVTTHSLEPLRPWKAEQLGGGYAVSRFSERTALEAADAVVAVSQGMRADVLSCYPGIDPGRVRVIPNGVDPARFRPVASTATLEAEGIDPDRPAVVFVGRITRQKGLPHLLAAAHHLPGEAQLILCAGQPDTETLAAEVRGLVEELQRTRGGVVWIDRMLAEAELVEVLSHARAFVCPSVYEPFGIVNLEAMACGVPVVASAVGGIPEVVADGETGFLVPLDAGEGAAQGSTGAGGPTPGQAPGPGGPADPEGFARALSDRIGRLVTDADLAHRMGAAGRRRVEQHFSWQAVADRTVALYRELLEA